MHKFIGHNGSTDNFYFADYFDCISIRDKLIIKKENPRTIYMKIENIKKFIDFILNIKHDFILISGCSDYSPQIYCNEEYLKIINMPNLIKWYAENNISNHENNISNHEKMFSLPVGFATHSVEYENNLLQIRQNININNKLNKIFCCWNSRYHNDCGIEFIERTMIDFIDKYPNLFDKYDPILSVVEFQMKLTEYKFCLCPLGNGLDVAPKILECFFLKTIPIVRKNPNVLNLYKNYPVIWVDNFTDILDMNLIYDENIDWDYIMNTFTCEYWYNKIIS